MRHLDLKTFVIALGTEKNLLLEVEGVVEGVGLSLTVLPSLKKV
jgi:hypothetical protein